MIKYKFKTSYSGILGRLQKYRIVDNDVNNNRTKVNIIIDVSCIIIPIQSIMNPEALREKKTRMPGSSDNLISKVCN